MFLLSCTLCSTFVSLATLIAGIALMLKNSYTVCFIDVFSHNSSTKTTNVTLICDHNTYIFNTTPGLLVDQPKICIDRHGRMIINCDTFTQQMGLLFVCLGSIVFMSSAMAFTRECLKVYTELRNSNESLNPYIIPQEIETADTTQTSSPVHQSITPLHVAEIDSHSEIVLAISAEKKCTYVIQLPRQTNELDTKK